MYRGIILISLHVIASNALALGTVRTIGKVNFTKDGDLVPHAGYANLGVHYDFDEVFLATGKLINRTRKIEKAFNLEMLGCSSSVQMNIRKITDVHELLNSPKEEEGGVRIFRLSMSWEELDTSYTNVTAWTHHISLLEEITADMEDLIAKAAAKQTETHSEQFSTASSLCFKAVEGMEELAQGVGDLMQPVFYPRAVARKELQTAVSYMVDTVPSSVEVAAQGKLLAFEEVSYLWDGKRLYGLVHARLVYVARGFTLYRVEASPVDTYFGPISVVVSPYIAVSQVNDVDFYPLSDAERRECTNYGRQLFCRHNKKVMEHTIDVKEISQSDPRCTYLIYLNQPGAAEMCRLQVSSDNWAAQGRYIGATRKEQRVPDKIQYYPEALSSWINEAKEEDVSTLKIISKGTLEDVKIRLPKRAKDNYEIASVLLAFISWMIDICVVLFYLSRFFYRFRNANENVAIHDM